MKIRFTQRVIVPGGPFYRPGDEVQTDPHQITPARAAEWVAKGWAQEIAMDAPLTKAPDAPAVDKMMTREKVSAKAQQ